ncbi:MAG: cobyrinate a,c-diamide synthase [Lachnospiraceae bacterium]|nr:cobyrinate a,c-diamide synthase [Lachnospiraceae bacterium]
MKKNRIPRVMIAAPSSGSGKTTITCGLLQILVNRKCNPISFKCGPDYIDPMFHRSVIGVPTGNIDAFFMNKENMRYLFAEMCNQQQRATIAVVEGVMGYYDGQCADSTKASSYEVARDLEMPVILVVNGSGASLSIAATIKGFAQFRTPSQIKGIILNQVSQKTYLGIKQCVERETGVEVLGYLPKQEGMVWQSRHLGLVLPDEVKDLQKELQQLSASMEQTIDVDRILAIAEAAEEFTYEAPKTEIAKEKEKVNIRIAIAMDAAFCFYYQESLQLLKSLGAELVPFSPLFDKELPERIQGIILGGGYPELYAKKLAQNETMKCAVFQALSKRLPCIAECGGFLYLQQTLTDVQEQTFPMVGFLDGHARKAIKRRHFGYITVSMKEVSILGKAGTQIPAHEFHYWESDSEGEAALAVKPDGKRTWACIRQKENVVAGFPHFYLPGAVSVAQAFIEACRAYSL